MTQSQDPIQDPFAKSYRGPAGTPYKDHIDEFIYMTHHKILSRSHIGVPAGPRIKIIYMNLSIWPTTRSYTRSQIKIIYKNSFIWPNHKILFKIPDKVTHKYDIDEFIYMTHHKILYNILDKDHIDEFIYMTNPQDSI